MQKLAEEQFFSWKGGLGRIARKHPVVATITGLSEDGRELLKRDVKADIATVKGIPSLFTGDEGENGKRAWTQTKDNARGAAHGINLGIWGSVRDLGRVGEMFGIPGGEELRNWSNEQIKDSKETYALEDESSRDDDSYKLAAGGGYLLGSIPELAATSKLLKLLPGTKYIKTVPVVGKVLGRAPAAGYALNRYGPTLWNMGGLGYGRPKTSQAVVNALDAAGRVLSPWATTVDTLYATSDRGRKARTANLVDRAVDIADLTAPSNGWLEPTINELLGVYGEHRGISNPEVRKQLAVGALISGPAYLQGITRRDPFQWGNAYYKNSATAEAFQEHLGWVPKPTRHPLLGLLGFPTQAARPWGIRRIDNGTVLDVLGDRADDVANAAIGRARANRVREINPYIFSTIGQLLKKRDQLLTPAQQRKVDKVADEWDAANAEAVRAGSPPRAIAAWARRYIGKPAEKQVQEWNESALEAARDIPLGPTMYKKDKKTNEWVEFHPQPKNQFLRYLWNNPKTREMLLNLRDDVAWPYFNTSW